MINFSSILPATAIKLLIYSSTLLCGQFLAILSLRWIPCSPFFWSFEIYQSVISPLVITSSTNRPEGLPLRLDEWPSSSTPPPKCLEIHFGHWSLARVAQWWEHLSPTNVALVQILMLTPYVGKVPSWFSPLLQEVFPRALQSSPLLNTSKFQFDLECTDRFQRFLMNS